MDGLTQEQIEIYADPARSAVSLIYDMKGNVIGNSQALARELLRFKRNVDRFCEDIEKACDRLGEE